MQPIFSLLIPFFYPVSKAGGIPLPQNHRFLRIISRWSFNWNMLEIKMKGTNIFQRRVRCHLFTSQIIERNPTQWLFPLRKCCYSLRQHALYANITFQLADECYRIRVSMHESTKANYNWFTIMKTTSQKSINPHMYHSTIKIQDISNLVWERTLDSRELFHLLVIV